MYFWGQDQQKVTPDEQPLKAERTGWNWGKRRKIPPEANRTGWYWEREDLTKPVYIKKDNKMTVSDLCDTEIDRRRSCWNVYLE